MIRTITPIFSIVIALVIFFFFAKPMFAEIKVLQGETEQYEEAAGKAVELNQTLASLINKKRSYSADDLERLDALVPSELEEVKVLTDLSEIARSHNMLFGNIKVANAENSKATDATTDEQASTQSLTYNDFTTTIIDFSLIGTYEQFKSFLADIEKSLVLLETTSINFDSGEGQLQQYTLSVQIYSLPPRE